MKLEKNLVKEKLARGEVCYGTMLKMVKDPGIIPLCSVAGWDHVIFDTEHGDGDIETLNALALTAHYEDLTFLVRVPDKLYHQMARILDVGAEGLVLPRVDDRETAEKIIQSTKYWPLGSRGASISQNRTLFRPCPATEYMEWANRETLTVIQVESRESVKNLDEILSVQGIDAVLVGPFDLSTNLGVPGRFDHPLVEEACEKVIEACRRRGVAPGIHMNTIEGVEKWRERGMRFLTYCYDSELLAAASREALSRLRSEG